MHRITRGLGQVRVPIILANNASQCEAIMFSGNSRARVGHCHKPHNRYIVQARRGIR